MDNDTFEHGKTGDYFGIVKYLRERYGDKLLHDTQSIEVTHRVDDMTAICIRALVKVPKQTPEAHGETDG